MRSRPRHLVCAGILALAMLAGAGGAQAQAPRIDELLGAVVGIKTVINPDARTAESLGRTREGSGIVIDEDGLVLTIGYLMVEAHAAEVVTQAGRRVPADVVGYDFDSGFGVLRAAEPLRVKPMALGKSADVAENDPVLVASAGGVDAVAPARVVAKREFAGNWEYLLEEALFTAPPHPAWSGAALINRDGKLVGVGSLIVGDATGKGDSVPGNMFVPIDRLPPILADLIADGRSSATPRPWLGITPIEAHGALVVGRVTAGGPAEAAGVQRGDMIAGVAGTPVRGMAEFYRKVWARGPAGTTIPVDILRDGALMTLEIKSMNRLDHLKLKSTF